MKYYINALRNYANFKGRARRKEYWMFILFGFLFSIVAAIIDNLGNTLIDIGSIRLASGYIYMLYLLAMLVPSWAVLVRRLHDVGKTGWFFLIAFIPLIGSIWLLVLLFTEGQPGRNQYGPNPKEPEIGFDSIDASF